MGRLVTRIVDNRCAPDACRWADRSPLDPGIWIVTGREMGGHFQVCASIPLGSDGDTPPFYARIEAPIGDLSPARVAGLDPALLVWVRFSDPFLSVTGPAILLGEWGPAEGLTPVFVCDVHVTEAPSDAV